jgi:hypothetical protein
LTHLSRTSPFTQNLREVAKSLEAVEKLNKLKVKTITSLHAIPSLPSGILDAVVAAADADDVKEIAGQFISKVRPFISSFLR